MKNKEMYKWIACIPELKHIRKLSCKLCYGSEEKTAQKNLFYILKLMS